MGTRVLLAISFVCAGSAVADMIQQDATGCGDPDSNNMTCTYYVPPLLRASPQGHAAPGFPWAGSRGDTSLFILDPGSPITNSKGTPAGNFNGIPAGNFKGIPAGDFKGTLVGNLAANLTGLGLQSNDDPAFDLVYSLTAGGTTYRIGQPLEFVFRMGSDETSGGGKPFSKLQSSDSVPLAVLPIFDRPRARELPEQTVWSEWLSISLGGAIIVGLAALLDRRILP